MDCLARVFHTYQANITVSQVLEDSRQNTFESRDILPQSLKGELDKGTLVLDPLHVGEVQLGFSLLDPTGVQALHYEYFAFALSDALNRCYNSSFVEPTKNLLH